jgi:glycosyltransferase involved in cell wall biosynthesis
MTSPRVTVIVATYNWSTVLPYSIGSVLGQTFTDFELLVIGDGCTDDSEAVVHAIGDPRVRWISLRSNSGHQSIPNNEGLRQARGESVAYLGHDDLWLPHHLSCLVDAFSPDVDLAYSMTEAVAPDGTLELHPLQCEYRPGMGIPPSSVMHRRRAVDVAGGWKHHHEVPCYPEVDLWERLSRTGGRVVFVPRLSVIKFPASWRKDAYKIRSCREQAAWLDRIRREPDLEAVELGKLLSLQRRMLSTVSMRPYRHVVADFWGETMSRIRRRMTGGKKRATVDEVRGFKGLATRQE